MKVEIPEKLYNKLIIKAKEEGFESVDSYIKFKLNEIILEEKLYKKEDKNIIKKRLKDLGYID